MRWAVAALAAFVGAVQLALFAVTERQAQVVSAVAGATPQAAGLRWVWVVGWTLPWLIGASLIVARRSSAGTAVVLTSAVLLVAGGLRGIGSALVWPPLTGIDTVSEGLERFGGLALWTLAAIAGAAAWAGRPRGGWRDAAPGPVGWYVTAAVLAWLPAAFRTTAFAPPGAPRRFVETDVATLSGTAELASYLGAVVIGALLWVAPRLRRDLAGAVLLTFALPTALGGIGDAVRVGTEEFVIYTPSGVLGSVGVAGLIVAGLVWLLGPDVSDGSTDPGRRPARADPPGGRGPG